MSRKRICGLAEPETAATGVEKANYHMEAYKQEFKPAHHEK